MGRGNQSNLFEQYRRQGHTVLGTAALLTYQLEAGSMTYLLDNDEMGDDATVTLPDISEARGDLISIRLWSLQSSKAVTLAALGTPIGWSNLTLDAADDNVLLYSDGFTWHILSNNIA